MIGLQRHIVQIVEHHPGWAALAATACRDIQRVAGDLIADLQHVGSTAVPDLPAKPILDIAAGVQTPEAISELIKRLPDIGYIYRGDGGTEGGHLFVQESSPDVRTIHLHVVACHDTQWRNYLLFRDLLRRDVAIRQQYAALKQELGHRFRDDRKSYTDAKHDFIRGVLAQGDL
jgi:GrpB-like predicted nucleotidyltransferase (UPF0157 family)